MSFASGHIIGGYLSGRIAEKIKNTKLPQSAWFFIILGALLPDSDFIIEWLFHTRIHRTLTHSLLFLIAVPLLTYLIFHILKNPNKKTLALAIGIGIFSHLILDFCTIAGIPLFYPFPTHFSIYGLSPPSPESFLNQDAAHLKTTLKFAVVDMALGAAFILYLWWRKKLKF